MSTTTSSARAYAVADATAPLLCAGITTYSPLRRRGVGPGQKVGIVGLGGLGHMGVKFACAWGRTRLWCPATHRRWRPTPDRSTSSSTPSLPTTTSTPT